MMYFRELFNKHYGGKEQTIPYYWLPKWCGDVTEASARVLDDYKESMKKEEEKLEDEGVFGPSTTKEIEKEVSTTSEELTVPSEKVVGYIALDGQG